MYNKNIRKKTVLNISEQAKEDSAQLNFLVKARAGESPLLF